MHIFLSDKVPYVVGLLMAIIGWHVSQIVNEISSTRAVSYSVEVNSRTGDVLAHIENVSRTKSLVNARFAIACASGTACFEPLQPAEEGEDPVYGDLRPVPPNFPAEAQRIDSAMSIQYRNTIAAGGEFHIVGRLISPDMPVNFYFIPDPANPLDIFIYDKNSLTGFLVENYLGILASSLLATVAILIASLIYRARVEAREQREEERK